MNKGIADFSKLSTDTLFAYFLSFKLANSSQ